MYVPNQSTTQVYSLFGTYVVEQHDRGFELDRRFEVPEPIAFERHSAPAKNTARLRDRDQW
jgi:hypothetical protein